MQKLYFILTLLFVLGSLTSAAAYAATNAPEEAKAEAEETLEAVLITPNAPAASNTDANRLIDRSEAVHLPRVDVIGTRPEQLDAVPGAASVITPQDLRMQAPISTNEALRSLPGVNVRDEEGIGLRPNIAIRGLNPSRSRQILVLEDGVPIALAPYGEPELYYAPPIERMERLELVKGSGSILYGPQTIGGVLNYITPDPPPQFTARSDMRYGSYGYYQGLFSVGDTVGTTGYLVSLMHGGFDGHRNLNLRRSDLLAKVHTSLGSSSSLGIKLNIYDETSNSTYLGLTTPQYENDPSANYAIHDVLPVRRYSLGANHSVLLTPNALLQTTAYASRTTRNWTRQDFDRSDGGGEYDRIIDGHGRDYTTNPGLRRPDDGSAIFFRQTSGSRNRTFEVAGIGPRLTFDYYLGDIPSELITGARFHVESVHEQRLDGEHPRSTSGALRDDGVRGGLALAGYVQNTFLFIDRLRVTPGLRYEAFFSGREVLRTRVVDPDSGRQTPTDLDPPASEDTTVTALIPGIGLSYQAAQPLTLYAGVHRGFSPPRTKDAITSDGDNIQLDAEYSWNYEMGARLRLARWLRAEVTGFHMDFSNQIIPPAEASGAAADHAANLVNSGQTTHQGVESSITLDSATMLGMGFELPVTVSHTYVRAEFGDGWTDDLAGNRLPYAPEHMLSGQVRVVHPSGLNLQVNGHYVTEQYTDKQNTREPSLDGLRGIMEPRLLLDARVAYNHKPFGLGVFVSGKNLTDERYIASRAPQGIQPGMFRQFIVGIQHGI